MSMIDRAERALQRCCRDQKALQEALQRYSVAVLQELCNKNGVEIDTEGSRRRLKKPYINALLSHKQKQRDRRDTDQTGLKLSEPSSSQLEMNKKRTIDCEEERNPKRQRRGETTGLKIRLPYFLPQRNKSRLNDEDSEGGSLKRQHPGEEPSAAVRIAQPATVEQLHMPVDTSNLSNGSKRPNPFSPVENERRKKPKNGRSITVRIYAARKDLKHTHEIQCDLTPDGGLDLVRLSQKMNLSACQVLDHRFSRPWVRKHSVLEKGAIKLLKGREDYLRVVGQS